MNNKTIIKIRRNNKPDALAMLSQWLGVAFYRFCDVWDNWAARYN